MVSIAASKFRAKSFALNKGETNTASLIPDLREERATKSLENLIAFLCNRLLKMQPNYYSRRFL